MLAQETSGTEWPKTMKEKFRRLTLILMDTDEGVTEEVYNLLVEIAHEGGWDDIVDQLTADVDATDGRFYFT